jgi:hypothetical protein
MIDLEADLKYWEDRLSPKSVVTEGIPTEVSANKLDLMNLNEYLFIKETRDIIIEYIDEENIDKKIILNLTELSLYDVFRYLVMKDHNTIDDILISFLGNEFIDINNILDDTHKVELITALEDISCINEMFKSSPTNDNTEDNKKTNMSDCIKAFGGTITYLCETWGKLPDEVLRSLTYRQFKWYLDIIVDKHNEIDKRTNGGKVTEISTDSNRASNSFVDTKKMLNQGYSIVEDTEGCVRFKKTEYR